MATNDQGPQHTESTIEDLPHPKSPMIGRLVLCAIAIGATTIAALGWLPLLRQWFGFERINWPAVAIIGLVTILVPRLTRLGRDDVSGKARLWLVGLHSLAIGCVWLGLFLGTYITSSPLDPNRLVMAFALAFSGLWVPALALRSVRQMLRLPRWHVAAACVFAIAFLVSIRSQGVDGEGRPMMAWRWQKAKGPLNHSNSNAPAIGATATAQPGETFIGEAWPQYMGVQRNGTASPMFGADEQASEKRFQLQWDIPVGAGWSSFASLDGIAYSQEMADDTEQVFAIRIRDGSRLWSTGFSPAFRSVIGGDGSRSTPTVTDQFVVALSATGMLACFDKKDGQVVWKQDVLSASGAQLRTHGLTGSPLVSNDRVFVFPGSDRGQAILAYDLRTGKLVASAGNQLTSYASLALVKLHDQPVLIAIGGEETVGYSDDLSRELFRIPFTNGEQTLCSQPIVLSDNELLLTAGYGRGASRIRLDVSSQPDQPWNVHTVWEEPCLQTKFSTTMVLHDLAFGLDNGILQCVRVSDGAKQWKAGRYGFGQLLACPPLILIQCEDGDIAAVNALPERLEEQFRFEALNGKTWNVPTWSRPYLLIRNDSRAQCYRVSTELR